MKTKIKFTEDYIKGVLHGIMIVKGAMPRQCYDVEVTTYDGQNCVLLKACDGMEEDINLDTLQEIQYAINSLFGEKCESKIKSDGVFFSIIEKDEY